MKKKILLYVCCAFLAGGGAAAQTAERLPGYVQAEKFTKEKLTNLLFSTTVDAHWLQTGGKFWYEYKTSAGRKWYVVDPATRSKTELFNLDRLAAEVTEIMRDPFTAQQLPIERPKTPS